MEELLEKVRKASYNIESSKINEFTKARDVEITHTDIIIAAHEAREYTQKKHSNYRQELKEGMLSVIPNRILKDSQRGNYSTYYSVSRFYNDNEPIVRTVSEEVCEMLEELGYATSIKIEDYNGVYKSGTLTISWEE